MLYKDYNFVGYKRNIEHKTKISRIDSIPESEILYTSIFRFSRDITKLESLADIPKGTKAYADFLVFDLDHSEDIEISHIECQRFVMFLNKIKVGHEVWFSGKKGYHILVPTCQFGLEPIDNELVLRKIAESLANKLTTWDASTYHFSRILRAKGSLHPETGLYKVPIENVLELNVSDVKSFAKEPTFNPYKKPHEYPINKTLVELYRLAKSRIIRKVSEADYGEEGGGLFRDAVEGQRNNECYKLARRLARRGINADDAGFIVNAWNDRLANPLSVHEVDKTVISAYKKGQNEYIDDSKAMGEIYSAKRILTLTKSLYSNPDNFVKTGFEFIDKFTMGFLKDEVIFWIARAGTFKTATLSALLRQISITTKKPTIYFSMDMSPDTLALRHIQQAEQMSQAEVFSAMLDPKANETFDSYHHLYRNVRICGLSNLSISQVIGLIDNFLEEYGELGAIGFDYMSLFQGCAADVQKTSQVAIQLKNRVVKAAGCPIFCLTQANRKFGDGDIEIVREAGKDSSSIEDAGTYIFGSWYHMDGGKKRVYGRVLKARKYDNRVAEEKPYFEIKINPEYMDVMDFEYVPEFKLPEFKQHQRDG